jgi:hypothetical protein
MQARHHENAGAKARAGVLLTALLITACGDKPQAPAPAPAAPEPAAAPAADPHAGHDHAAAAEPVALPELAPNARVFFVSPADGAAITGPLENGAVSIKVQMGAENVAVKPAGALEAGSGHHHVLIDVGAMPAGTVVPKDETHQHFGKGETEAMIRVPAGTHKLTLQLADGIHRSYGESLSSTISVTINAAGSVAATAP